MSSAFHVVSCLFTLYTLKPPAPALTVIRLTLRYQRTFNANDVTSPRALRNVHLRLNNYFSRRFSPLQISNLLKQHDSNKNATESLKFRTEAVANRRI